MKIKSLGFTSVKLTFKNLEVVTDPIEAKEYTNSFEKTAADVAVFTSAKYAKQIEILKNAGFDSKLDPKQRGAVFEISNPGEMELGEVFIRRSTKSNFYIFDEDDIRVVLLGFDSKDIELNAFKDLGDVDVLIIPVGAGEIFMDHERLEKVIEMIDPTNLVPTGYKGAGVKADVASWDEFIKYFGYTHITEESTFNVTKGKEEEEKIMNVVLLK